MKFSGSDWLKESLRVGDMSEIGEAVGDLLGDIYRGIYHINSSALEKVDWSDPYSIEIVLPPEFCTVDGNKLTELVVLCHDRMIRCSIQGISSWGHMKMRFHQRNKRSGMMHERYPTIEDVIKDIRDAFPQPKEQS